MGITKFADMTHQEFLDMLNFNKVSKPKTSNGNNVFVPPPMEDVSKSIDWRSRGVVTEVKDQGNCGSCWSFSATGSIEGQYAIKNKKLASLSEQNLIDCSSFYGDLGCDGGLMDYAFEYVRDYGLMTEEAYPYIAMEGVCYYSDSDSVVKLESFVDVPKADEDALLAAVSTIGPVSVAVDASDFQLYTEGIMDSTYCGNTILYLNHGVLATGFNTTKDGVDYWIVKNSWGSSWGEEGYIRMIRNKNMCGIATSASYPVLKLK